MHAGIPPPPGTLQPPGAGTPRAGTLPWSRHPRSRHPPTPWEQASPIAPPSRHPPQSRHPPGAGTPGAGTPGAGTPLGAGAPPQCRHPLEQAPPPPSRRLLLRTVRILLECILVFLKFCCTFPISSFLFLAVIESFGGYLENSILCFEKQKVIDSIKTRTMICRCQNYECFTIAVIGSKCQI